MLATNRTRSLTEPESKGYNICETGSVATNTALSVATVGTNKANLLLNGPNFFLSQNFPNLKNKKIHKCKYYKSAMNLLCGSKSFFSKIRAHKSTKN